jgi:hypothetical protein
MPMGFAGGQMPQFMPMDREAFRDGNWTQVQRHYGIQNQYADPRFLSGGYGYGDNRPFGGYAQIPSPLSRRFPSRGLGFGHRRVRMPHGRFPSSRGGGFPSFPRRSPRDFPLHVWRNRHSRGGGYLDDDEYFTDDEDDYTDYEDFEDLYDGVDGYDDEYFLGGGGGGGRGLFGRALMRPW